MKILGYGSLMNQLSLKHSNPEARILQTAVLEGYRRVFNFKSPYRHNPATGVFSSVLNLAQDASSRVTGLVIEIDESLLMEREVGYQLESVMLQHGEKVATYIARDYATYSYVFNDPVQEEYLVMCAVAAREHGFLENFLDHTFVLDKPLRHYRDLCHLMEQKSDSIELTSPRRGWKQQ